MEILRLDHIEKYFGEVRAIQDLTLTVDAHSVFGFIGKNGAGKTTTMKMIMGFLPPSSGEIYVCGEKVNYGDTKTNRHIGYLPDVPEFYGYMFPEQYLELCGEIAGQKPTQIKKKVTRLLQLVGLKGVRRKIEGFSRGMKQRLGIAQALLNQPKLLICDEPTSALDPIGRKEILEILSKVSEQTTILFSTHILSDVERICDRIGILDQGKLIVQGNLAEIRSTYRQDTILIELADQNCPASFTAKLRSLPFVSEVVMKENTITIHLTDITKKAGKILEILAREQIPVIKYEVLEPSLENVFLEMIK